MKTSIKILGLITIISLWAFSSKTKIHQPLLPKASEVAAKHPAKQNSIKVALLLDTSNSMDGLIDQAKAQLWEIINQLSFAKHDKKHPNLYIALYEYGNDRLESSDKYIRKVIDFSNDLDLISEKLFSLTTDGGSEYCGAVIQTSLDDLKWGKKDDDLNLIFIAGNESFTQGEVSYVEATANANKKRVTVNTIFCGDYNTGVSGEWAAAAAKTNGDYFAINQNKKHVYIATPYDDIIIQLNIKLNATYIGYGRQGHKKMALQSVQDDNAIALNEVVAVKRAVSKSNHLYNNASWDLVDASKEKEFSYQKVKRTDLPKELRKKTPKELEVYVSNQAKKRDKIQKQINSLNLKRKKFIAEKQTKNISENLENAIISTLKKQAKKRNYTW